MSDQEQQQQQQQNPFTPEQIEQYKKLLEDISLASTLSKEDDEKYKMMCVNQIVNLALSAEGCKQQIANLGKQLEEIEKTSKKSTQLMMRLVEKSQPQQQQPGLHAVH